MKTLPISGAEWTVKLTRSLLPNSPSLGIAFERGWSIAKHEGEETRVIKLTLAGDHEAVMAASAGLREAWVGQGWSVAHVGWRTRTRLPKPAPGPQLPLPVTAVEEGPADYVLEGCSDCKRVEARPGAGVVHADDCPTTRRPPEPADERPGADAGAGDVLDIPESLRRRKA